VLGMDQAAVLDALALQRDGLASAEAANMAYGWAGREILAQRCFS
jgi:hypothetical protein